MRIILTDEQVLEVRKLHTSGITYPALAARFGVSRFTIRNICLFHRRVFAGTAIHAGIKKPPEGGEV